ncbi:hypothetical protein LC087_02085 [Bacillus carboniphilus]|uniref:Uncharacterized protein n=1 Tax=Bacillus carboniphilus TaxID=86663 RepID=A0ABY9JUH8_9BACI|nr:hypothetical protein [Bacillus carboniphilus]WLR43032.1 hypothetical protein LC087_02085 [Bacillus carboniphilus]
MNLVKAFFSGFALLLVLIIVGSLGLGVYADLNNWESFTFDLFGTSFYRFENFEDGGHRLHFKLGIIWFGVVGGILNALLAFFIHRFEQKTS